MTDSELQSAVRSGDHRVLEFVYRENFDMIRSMVRKLNQAVDPQDIYQEAMLVLVNAVYDKDLSCKISTFLYSVARNLTLKQLRDNKKMYVTDEVKEVDVSDDMEAYDIFQERRTKLKQALSKLGQRCQQIIEMFYMRSMNMEEIASELGYTNADNAKNQKYKCTKKLKELVRG